MSEITINRGEAPISGFTLELTIPEAQAVYALIEGETACNATAAGIRNRHVAIYPVISELGAALAEAGAL